MQVQRWLTTKDLDDAQVGYEKKYDDARAGSLIGFASEGNYPLVGLFSHMQLSICRLCIRSLLILPSKTFCSFIDFSPKRSFRGCVWYFPAHAILSSHWLTLYWKFVVCWFLTTHAT